jgi:microcystin degradation protein MlrC
VTRRVRIAIAGISSESSTFSLGATRQDRFVTLGGSELLAQYRFAERLGAVGLGADELEGVEWVPVFRAAGQSGGPIDPRMYDGFVHTVLAGLRAAVDEGPLDGVYLDIHGAMHVAGRDDAEESLVAAIRDVVGEDCVLSASMDPHGNLSRRLASLLDLAAVHRESPHVDTEGTRTRAVQLLIETIRSGVRPRRAWVRIPMLLPGERSGTFVSPGREIADLVGAVASRDGIADAGFWVGYYWADEPRNAAAVLVTGSDLEAVLASASEVASAAWDARHGFGLTASHVGSFEDGLAFAATGVADRPVWISDSGDNWTGGGDGDTTVALHAALADPRGLRILFGGLHDPGAVDAAVAAGTGGTVTVGVGAWLSDRYAPPAPGPWHVERLIEGRYGEGLTAALLTQGSVAVIVQRRRAVFTRPDDPAYVPRQIPGQAWIDPATLGADVVVVKNGYLFPGQEQHAGSHFLALTPGGTDLDDTRLEYAVRARPLYPFEDGFPVDLTPVLL